MRILIIFFILKSFILCQDDTYVLLISFDGFRYDYMNSIHTPNFDFVEQNGTKATSLKPVFPSLTFPNHYSIATGAYSANHNITGNTFYDKKLNKKYSLYDKKSVRNPDFYKSEPIWVTAEKQNIKTGSFFWVGTEAPIKGVYPSIFKFYDGAVPFKSRIDSVINWFQIDGPKRPRLILLYFSEPDHTGHIYGINRNKINESVSEMDNLLGYLIDELKKIEIFSKLNIIITSDHGMVDVSENKLIVLDDFISDLDKVYIDGSGSHVQIDYKVDDEYYINNLFNDLISIPNSRVWKKSDIPAIFNFTNNNTGDFLLLADEGWFITTNSLLSKKKFTLRGMHGYDPSIKNMHGIFYAMGPQIKSNYKINSFENIHIYSLICKILNIEEYKGIDGPDGNIKVLENILKWD
tara:strand:- start:1205 stop:2425 length:1221 start_codon:yes stop_codon:yes gene_type:complete